MLDLDKSYYSDSINKIAGVDEVGRGPLAGPVVACALILPKDYFNEEINDSKKLSQKKREVLFEEIKKVAIKIGIGIVDADTIDEINIYEATKIAMKKALDQLNDDFDMILVDAMPLIYKEKEVVPIIKGDAKCQCIAAASIIAKVTRDKMMEEVDKTYPMYHFKDNKGYGTKAHIEAIKTYGLIDRFHRKSFNLKK